MLYPGCAGFVPEMRNQRDQSMGSTLKQRGKTGTFWYHGHWRGRRYRQTLGTTDRREAERLQRQLDAQYDSGAHRPGKEKNPAIDDIWNVVRRDGEISDYTHDTGLYIDWLREHRSHRTIDTQRNFWAALIAFTKARRLGDIRRDDLERFKRAKVKAGDWSQSTANNMLKDVKAIYNRCRKERWYDGENPALTVERYTLTRREPEPHSINDVERLLVEARKIGRGAEWTVLLGVFAGLRRIEMANARWEWMDFHETEPMIRIKKHEGFAIKDREERSIPMNARIREALEPYAKTTGFVFESTLPSTGKWYYHFDARKPLIEALEAAELRKDDPFQRLRVTFACLLAAAGVDIFRVSKWLGHSSVKVTERYYATVKGYHRGIDAI
jgi:integrase